MQPTLIFYTTESCHLCEEAEKLLNQLSRVNSVRVEAIDISTDEELVSRYGLRIPVVKNRLTDREIGCPFDLAELANLI